MPLIEPWRTAYGEDPAVHSVLARMCTANSDAWGESAPFAAPCYSPEWAGGLFVVARDWLAPALIGVDLPTGDSLQARLAMFKGNPFAKAVLDSAWWSLSATISETPLHRLLGATRDWVPVGADFGVMDDLDQLLDRVDEAVSQKFARIKLKYRPGWDEPMVAAVRARQPGATIHIDCNSGYQLSDVDMFQRLDEYQLAMFEQPLGYDDLIDHRALQAAVATPVCLDESINSVERARQALKLESCRLINIKPGRVGGLTNALSIHNLCQRGSIPCWVGGMLESAVGAASCAALAMLDNFSYPADIFPSSRFYHVDLSDQPLKLTLNADGVPGIAPPLELPSPDMDRLRTATLQSAVVGG
jgi:O-succinylbenzoate synthase